MALLEEATFAVSIILLFLVSIRAGENMDYANSITISHNGTDNTSCLNGTIPCKTLNFTLQNLKNSTQVTMVPGTYHLSIAHSFTWLEDFALLGISHATANVTIRCGKESGLSFQKSRNLVFQGIKFTECGNLHESTTGNAWVNFTRAKFYAGLFLSSCTDLTVASCSFVSSPGVGVNLYDVGGSVNISQSWFEKNGPKHEFISYANGSVEAGGGLYIEFTAQGSNDTRGTNAVNNSNYLISDCHFTENHAPQPRFEDETEMDKNGDDHIPFGRGGGISIFVRGSAESNTILIERCLFLHNIASWGGGVFFELNNKAQNTIFNITHSVFEKNWVKYAGGGTRTGSSTTESTEVLKENWIIHEDCNFTGNHAIFGGGVSHYGPTYLPANNKDGRSHQVYFVNCYWVDNEATAGSAIGINVLSESQIRVHPLVPFYVTLETCCIRNNRIIQTEDHIVNGFGALYTNFAHLILKGDVTFENNSNMTALLLDNAFVYVHNKTVFRNNSGEWGGAVALYGESQIITWRDSILLFENNNARSVGGAIYVRAPGPPMAAFETRKLAIHECFISFEHLKQDHVDLWHTKIIFVNNTASEGGNSVYATTLQSCYKRNETRKNNLALNWPRVMNFSDANQTSDISTDAVLIQVNNSDWHVAPSQRFDATVKLYNERNITVRGVVQINIVPKEKNCTAKLTVPSTLFIVQNGQVEGLKFRGGTGCIFSVQFKSPSGRQFVQTFANDVKLRGCYPGFKSGNKNETCECMDSSKHRGISRCGIYGKHLYLKRGYWFGKVGNVFDTYPCPEHYCTSNHTLNETALCHLEMESEFPYDENSMCASNRNGTLCGSCKKNYSVHLGDEKCSKDCTNLKLLWLIGYFIITFIAVLVVLAIPYLDIFTSYLNAWLFSFQVVNILNDASVRLDKYITAITNLANWEVSGVGVCLFNGMNNLNKHAINYMLPGYILVLLVILMVVAKRRPNVYFKHNVFAAFCALLVLCYTNITAISFDLIDYVQVGEHYVLLSDGDIHFSNWKQHLPFTIVAGLCIIIIVVSVPLILLINPKCITRYRSLRNICDTFRKCYRTDYEWFAAFYFICRIYLNLTIFLPLGTFAPMRRSILEISTVLILVICVYIKPYHEDYHILNSVDTALLTNLCFITIFSTTMESNSSKDINCAVWWIVDILCWFPIAVLAFLVYRYRHNLLARWNELVEKLKQCWQACLPNEESFQPISDEPSSTSNTNASGIE